MTSLLANSFTNPLMNYAYNYLSYDLGYLEILVTIAEIPILASLLDISYLKATQISVVANLVTLLAGLLLFK